MGLGWGAGHGAGRGCFIYTVIYDYYNLRYIEVVYGGEGRRAVGGFTSGHLLYPLIITRCLHHLWTDLKIRSSGIVV